MSMTNVANGPVGVYVSYLPRSWRKEINLNLVSTNTKLQVVL